MTKVKIRVNHSLSNTKEYMPLYRSLIYLTEVNVVPMRVFYPEEVENLIDGQLLSRRLGLVAFEYQNPDTKGTLLETFQLSNVTNKAVWLKSSAFTTERVRPVSEDQIIFALAPNSKFSIKIQFGEGRGAEHSRYSLIQGYRLNTVEDEQVIEYETSGKKEKVRLELLKDYVKRLSQLSSQQYLKKLNFEESKRLKEEEK